MDTYKIERLFHLLMERLDRHEKMLDDLLFRSQRQSANQEEGTEYKLYNGERLYDNQDLCLMLQVSKRSLQRYRTLGILPYSCSGRRPTTRSRTWRSSSRSISTVSRKKRWRTTRPASDNNQCFTIKSQSRWQRKKTKKTC